MVRIPHGHAVRLQGWVAIIEPYHKVHVIIVDPFGVGKQQNACAFAGRGDQGVDLFDVAPVTRLSIVSPACK